MRCRPKVHLHQPKSPKVPSSGSPGNNTRMGQAAGCAFSGYPQCSVALWIRDSAFLSTVPPCISVPWNCVAVYSMNCISTPSNSFLNRSVMLSPPALCDMKTYKLALQDTKRWVLPFVLDLSMAPFLWRLDFLFSHVLLGHSWEKLCSSHPAFQDQWCSFLKGNKCCFQWKNVVNTSLQKKKE